MAGQHADGAIVGATLMPSEGGRGASAIAWADGVIVGVGSDAEIMERCDGRSTIIDGGGMTLTPGLVDAHIHPFITELTRGADLTACADLDDLRAALTRHREELPDDPWLLGWGLSYGVFEGTTIHGRHLSRAVGDIPVFLMFMDQHTGLASEAALRLGEVTGAERFREGAEAVVEDGVPTGELRENAAMDLVRRVIPKLTPAELRKRRIEVMRNLNRVGLTGAHVMDGRPETLTMARELKEAGDLTVRLILPMTQVPEASPDQRRADLEHVGESGRIWRGGMAKFFIDGVVDSGTAWLGSPDTEGRGQRPFWPDPDEYRETVRMFAAAGFQCVTHAVGDRAVAEALAAYAEAPLAGAPHRVEHLEVLDESGVRSFADSSAFASMQPLHMQWRNPEGTDSWASRLGPERCRDAFPAKSLIRSGVTVALGSDWPIADYDPRVGMAWARLRRDPGNPGIPPFEPDQRLSGEEALHGYTVAPAVLAGESDRSGRLAVGMRADITAFGGDPVRTPAEELPDLPILLTVVDGRVVHRVD